MPENNPCHGCQKREVGCHSGCQEYQKWKTEYENEKPKYADYPEMSRMMKRHIWKKQRWK